FSNTQAVEALVGAIQQLLGFADPTQVRVFWYEGASSFGPGNRYVDTAKAAAIMSKLAGAPVRVQLMRWDEHGWKAYGPAQLMDELAFAAGIDPIAFRRQNISDDRWLAVMNAAVQAAGWKPRVASTAKQSGDVVRGRGFGFGRHGSAGMAAAVVEIEVDKKT